MLIYSFLSLNLEKKEYENGSPVQMQQYARGFIFLYQHPGFKILQNGEENSHNVQQNYRTLNGASQRKLTNSSEAGSKNLISLTLYK